MINKIPDCHLDIAETDFYVNQNTQFPIGPIFLSQLSGYIALSAM